MMLYTTFDSMFALKPILHLAALLRNINLARGYNFPATVVLCTVIVSMYPVRG